MSYDWPQLFDQVVTDVRNMFNVETLGEKVSSAVNNFKSSVFEKTVSFTSMFNLTRG